MLTTPVGSWSTIEVPMRRPHRFFFFFFSRDLGQSLHEGVVLPWCFLWVWRSHAPRADDVLIDIHSTCRSGECSTPQAIELVQRGFAKGERRLLP